MKFIKSVFIETIPFFVKSSFLILFCSIIVFILLSNYTQNKNNDDIYTFSVDGEAKIEVNPDIANITIGTYLEGSDVIELQNNANKSINNATQFIKDLGIDEKKIKTQNYLLSNTYNYSSNQIDKYFINISLHVEVPIINNDKEIVGKVLSAASNAGLDQVSRLDFDISNRDEILEELKIEAIEDGKSKKDALANASGLKLGKLQSVNFYNEGNYPFINYYQDAESKIADSIQSDSKLNEEINIETGVSTITSNVTLIYEIN